MKINVNKVIYFLFFNRFNPLHHEKGWLVYQFGENTSTTIFIFYFLSFFSLHNIE
jgi:hypothetical protein